MLSLHIMGAKARQEQQDITADPPKMKPSADMSTQVLGSHLKNK
jgi:hypothetical protein